MGAQAEGVYLSKLCNQYKGTRDQRAPPVSGFFLSVKIGVHSADGTQDHGGGSARAVALVV